jgi:hypothetical protein
MGMNVGFHLDRSFYHRIIIKTSDKCEAVR